MEDTDIKRGTVDGIDDDWIYGWAYDPRKTAARILLDYAGETYETIICNQYREDLKLMELALEIMGLKHRCRVIR
jgi:hypothetical protein